MSWFWAWGTKNRDPFILGSPRIILFETLVFFSLSLKPPFNLFWFYPNHNLYFFYLEKHFPRVLLALENAFPKSSRTFWKRIKKYIFENSITSGKYIFGFYSIIVFGICIFKG